ncbi:proton sodium-glutamate symport protein [Staphylococcus gallinarum]|uniref:Proton sodium-glutamate symport protein n=1 Tax=Staphylococcus gallinarum TaxID=1293 RepID=A0A380FL75_STAGA|nr:proton sodium-glutamate symport protein [Staphylococcus gallinarum]
MELKQLCTLKLSQTVAIGLGIVFANIFKPGIGLDPDKLPKGDISTYESSAKAAEHSTYGKSFY